MKYIYVFIGITAFWFTHSGCKEAKAEKEISFTVYGNCGMCEKTIEGALDKDGIYTADWNKETKQMLIRYDSLTYSESEIHRLIANAGYDTDLQRAPDEAYEELHECCQYERPL